MANGKVDFFNDTGGYGFIETDDADEDVFFHMEDVGGEDLTEGTEISSTSSRPPRARERRTSFGSKLRFYIAATRRHNNHVIF